MNLSMAEDEYADDADEIGVPKYKQYSLEGGTNYQEILYTLPEFYEAAKHDFNTGENVTLSNNKPLENINPYQSPHWRERNVLAHVRTQDFKDTSENKLLFARTVAPLIHMSIKPNDDIINRYSAESSV